MFLGDFGAEKFVIARIHASIFCEQFKNVGFFCFMFLARRERGSVEAFSRAFFDATVFMAANCDRSATGVEIKKLGDEVWFNRVVTIDETNIIAGGEFQASIASGGLATIFLMDGFDALIFFGISVDDLGSIIGRTIVYQNNFEILMGLFQNRI